MKNQLTLCNSRALPRFLRATCISGFLAAILLLLGIPSIYAGSATWKASPATGDWNTANNWMPATVPNAATDKATFGSSNQTDISLSAKTEVEGISFDPGASDYRITVPSKVTLSLKGIGITNNSGMAQNFFVDGGATGSGSAKITFLGSAMAGTGTFFTVNGAKGSLGLISFLNKSSAGFANFTANGIDTNISFVGTATAGHGTFTLNGGSGMGFNGRDSTGPTAGNATIIANAGEFGAEVQFGVFSTAGDATLVANGGGTPDANSGIIFFGQDSTAGNATLIANGGVGGGAGGEIKFFRFSDGGTARLKVFGNGMLIIFFTRTQAGSLQLGSLEGDGTVFLGSTKLIVGGNNLDTTFSGQIHDGQPGSTRTGASLKKVGGGQLVLSGANTYTAGTTINGGKLLINNASGSGTGSGAVQVDTDTLGGRGTIAGAVTIGKGNGPGAILSPASGAQPGTLTIQSPLVFNSDATYNLKINSHKVLANKVAALGVTINSGAQFVFSDFGSDTLPTGTVFKVIDNTAATPIAGTFSNLPDGSTFTSKGNTYKVNYEGGTGNDLTLNVQ